jgi:hypothetical protein
MSLSPDLMRMNSNLTTFAIEMDTQEEMKKMNGTDTRSILVDVA